MLAIVAHVHKACAALCGSRDESGVLLAEEIAALCPEDRSEHAAYIREALCNYVNSRAWMHDPPAPPLPLADLLAAPDGSFARPIGAIAQAVYEIYYQAVRAHVVATTNYESYRVWLRILTNGPQPLIPRTFPDIAQLTHSSFYTYDECLALAHVREAMERYLLTLRQLSIGLWTLPPAAPPSVRSLLAKSRI